MTAARAMSGHPHIFLIRKNDPVRMMYVNPPDTPQKTVATNRKTSHKMYAP
jgi:hypothetical protein